MRRVARQMPTKGKRRRERLGEIKFSSASSKTRRNVLTALAERPDIDVILLAVDKEGRGVADTPENYAAAISYLLQASDVEFSQLHMMVDKHFTRPARRAAFDRRIKDLVGSGLTIEHVDSQQDTRVQLADFVAGAALRWYAFGDNLFRALIEERIVAEKLATWREMKNGKNPGGRLAPANREGGPLRAAIQPAWCYSYHLVQL